MSAMVLIPLLLTGMATGTVFASGSDVNRGGGRYTAQADNGSLGNLQPTNLPSPSPLTTSSVSPSPAQTPTGLSDIHTDTKIQPVSADSHTVVFDPANGSKAERVTVQDGSLASPPADNPKRDGYRFDGWSEHEAMMDFRTPITRDITLKAKWTPVNDWTLSPDHGPASGGTSVTITPPSADSPSFSTLEAHDCKLIGVTGDGRLYAWTTNDKMPVQVPSPQGESGEVRFTSGVVGDDSYAALSRDHLIYTWNGRGETPALLNIDSTTYTSIAMAADRLIAVNQEGRIRTWTSKEKPTGKAISLPTQALAVKAAGNADRLLALDSKGQVWTWKPDAIDTDQIQHVKLANRIVQISAMDHGFMLLDSTGEISYLDNGQTQPEPVVEPDHSAITAISSNAMQATLIDSIGRVWAWKPGEVPTRADDGSQQYLQAVKADSRITAFSRQGSLYRWSLDEQGQPGKPARIDTTQAPTLESASLDGHSLTLTKKNNAWQVEALAHKLGPATITITGRQDGQPFIKSLKYTFGKILTRDVESQTSHMVDFNTGEGGPTPDPQEIPYPYGRVKRPSLDPAREGFLFDGWFIGDVAYDFSGPVDQDLTLTAKWTPASRNSTWSISPDKGSQLGRESTTITPPDTNRGFRFNQVSGGIDYNFGFSLAVGSDGNAYAWGYNRYGQLGDGTRTTQTMPVRVKMPDRKTYPDLPEDFTYVQVSAGDDHSLALGSDGYAYAWGNNSNGQLGDNTISYSSVPVRVRDPASPNDASKGLQAVQVSSGYQHSLALDADGNIWAWGYNGFGQLGNNTIPTGRNKNNAKSLVPVRVRDPASPNDASKGLQALQVSAGGYHSLALVSGGYVYAWGINCDGQLGNNTSSGLDGANPIPVRVRDPASPNDASKGLHAIQVSGGGDHSLALGSDGYVYAWGFNNNGQLGNNTRGANPNPVPERVRDPDSPTDTSSGLKASQVSAGLSHSVAVDREGNAWAWGTNNNGQLGNNTSGDTANPVPVRVRDPASPTDTSKVLKATQINAGGPHSLALGTDGNAYAWGSNSNGQLGNDSIPTGANNGRAQSPVPVPVSFNLTPVITGIRFDQTPVSGLTRGDGSSVSVLTPAHQPGTVTVSVDFTLGGTPQTPDTSLRYTYLPAGVLPKAGGEGILLALAAGMTGMGGVLASRRHRREQHQLSHASHG